MFSVYYNKFFWLLIRPSVRQSTSSRINPGIVEFLELTREERAIITWLLDAHLLFTGDDHSSQSLLTVPEHIYGTVMALSSTDIGRNRFI